MSHQLARLGSNGGEQALALASPDETQRGPAHAAGVPEGAAMETLDDRRKQLVELEARFALQARARTNEVLPGFNADAPPSVLPEYISGSVLSDVLLESENEPRTIDDPPSIYDEYKRSTTRGGVTFGVCIKPGMDLKPELEEKLRKSEARRFETEITPIGLVAGDDECYEMFHRVFDAVVQRAHEGRQPPNATAQPILLEPHKVRETGDVDPGGKYVVHTTVEARRNLATVALGPGANSNDRREAEQILTTAACGASESDIEDNEEEDDRSNEPRDGHRGEQLSEGFASPNNGSYYPMPESWSYASVQNGMSPDKYAQMMSRGLCFGKCVEPLEVAAGYGRDYPDARGCYLSDDERCYMWINQEDHCRLFVQVPSADVQAGFQRWCGAMESLESGIKSQGAAWSRHNMLGYVTCCPSLVGTGGFRVTVRMRTPLLCRRFDYRELVRKLELEVRYVDGQPDPSAKKDRPVMLEDPSSWRQVDVRNRSVKGWDAASIVSVVAAGMRVLVDIEDALQRAENGKAMGEDITMDNMRVQTLVDEIHCAARDELVYQNALGPIQRDYECPESIPFMLKPKPKAGQDGAADAHWNLDVNLLVDHIRNKPLAYRDSWHLKTSLGVPYGLCIRPGANNPHNTHSSGLIAGDEECYTTFNSTFQGVVEQLHGPWGEGRRFISALDPLDYQFQMRKTQLDSRYVMSVRVRAARNFAGHRFPPACSAEERRVIEKAVAKALLSLQGDMKGSYYPLHGSQSYRKMRGGMSASAEEQMRAAHLLFEKPHTAMQIAGGYHREWPDARGVFQTVPKDFVVWVNDKDHMRMFTSQNGSDIQKVFLRFCEVHAAVEYAIKAQGLDFIRNDRYGYVSSDPKNIGTSLRASVMIKLKLLCQVEEFEEVISHLHLECFTDTLAGPLPKGQFLIGNVDRLRTDLQLVNCLIDGIEQLINMEQSLERGDTITNQLFRIRNAHKDGNIYPVTPPFPEHKCPDTIPDLADHNNLCARALRVRPDAYHRYKGLSTGGGVPFARCLKSAVDIKGQYGTKYCGIIAGDEECYKLFREIFDPVIEMRHNFSLGQKHVTNWDVDAVRGVPLDPDGKYIFSCQLRTARNLRGYRLPPACTRDARRKIEATVVKALLHVGEDHKDDEDDGYVPDRSLLGKYYPLMGSTSYKQQPMGMSMDEQADLRKNHLLFGEPNSEQLVSGGFHHEWPDARGVFFNHDRDVLAWINQEDHVRIFAMEMGGNLKRAFGRLAKFMAGFERRIEKQKKELMHSDRLGYLSTDPGNLGTGLRVRLILRLPQLTMRDDFVELMSMLRLECAVGDDGMVDVSNEDRLGRTEVELTNVVIHAAEKILAMESALELGNYLAAESIIKEIRIAHETDAVYGSSHFPEDDCPLKLPDLGAHKNVLASVLRADPSLYTDHREVVTQSGVGLGRLIKPGMHHIGAERMSGMVAGDEECYHSFQRLFDPVIEKLHPPFRRNPAHLADRHVSNFNAKRLLDTPIDPKGGYVISSRIRIARNIRGYRLPPSCTAEERRDLEAAIANALDRLQSEVQGDYFPLTGSESYDLKPGGMAPEQELGLRKANLLFNEPTTPALIAGGYHRDWPDARGIFANDEQNFLVWVNEKDHMRIITTTEGPDLQSAFVRFCGAIGQVEESLSKSRLEFMTHEHLGYLTTDPSNIGTGLRASLMMRLPHMILRPDFLKIVAQLRLEARPAGTLDQWETTGDWPKLFGDTTSSLGSAAGVGLGDTMTSHNSSSISIGYRSDEEQQELDEQVDDEQQRDAIQSGGGAVCIGNLDRLGRTEVELVNLVIYGAARLVQMEELLEAGEPLESLLSEMEMYRARAQESFAYVFSSEHTTLAKTTERPDPELSQAELGGVGVTQAQIVTPGDDVVQPPTAYKLSVAARPVHGRDGSDASRHEANGGGRPHETASVSKSKSCVLQ